MNKRSERKIVEIFGRPRFLSNDGREITFFTTRVDVILLFHLFFFVSAILVIVTVTIGNLVIRTTSAGIIIVIHC